MEGLLHTIQHSVSHFWCCYWNTIKAMILPVMSVLGTLYIVEYKINDYLKR